MFLHRLPNGKRTMHSGLPRELAIKRMEDHERWCQEHREELEVSSQQLWDDMFGSCQKLSPLKFTHSSNLMQLTSRKHSMVIDIHPHVNFPGSKYVWKLSFRGEEQTQKVINHKEMIECIRARIDLGYEVTDYHSVPVNANICMC